MHLFIDGGNSCVKYLCLAGAQADWQQAAVRLCRHQGDVYARLAQQWQALPPIDGIYLADVGGHASALESLSQQLWGLRPQLMSTQAQQLGLHNAYQRYQDLGVDRWLGMLAAHHCYSGCKCIIDCGTAVTVDLLAANGEHQGGLISPGSQTMYRSLQQQTNNIDVNPIDAHCGLWGRSTETCVSLGVQLAARSFISEVIELAREFFKDNVTIVFCGGQAQSLLQQYKLQHTDAQSNNKGCRIVYDQNLVLKGVAFAAGFKPCE